MKDLYTGFTDINTFKSNKIKNKNKVVNNNSDDIQTHIQDTKYNIKIEAIKAKLYLSVKNREGKNKLMEKYIERIQGLIGA